MGGDYRPGRARVVRVAGDVGRSVIRAYISNVLIAFDLFCNVLLLGKFYTISSRALRGYLRGSHAWSAVYHALNAIQANHCENALRGDIGRAEATLQDLATVKP